MFVHSYVRSFVSHVCGIYHKKFYIKVSQVGYISLTTHQKAFIFAPWVPWRVYLRVTSYGPSVHAQGGVGGQNVGHFKNCYIALSLMLILSNNIMLEIRHPYDLGFYVMR